MLIESLIKRKDGTKVEMEGPDRVYHFKPSENDTRHIADIDVDVHAKMFLRIREGYKAVDPVDFEDDEDGDTGRHLNGSNIHSASYTIKGGDVIALEDLVNMAFDDSGLSEDEWNQLDDADRYAYIDTTLSELQDGIKDENQNAEPADQPGDADPEPEDTHSDDSAPDQSDEGADVQEVAKQSDPEPTHANDLNGDGVPDDLEGLSRPELVERFKARFGRNPSTKMTIPQIIAALSEEED